MIAIVRIRGLTNIRPEIRKAFETFNLDRKNHCVLVSLKEDDPGLKKIQDYAAYGKVSAETVGKLIQKRGRIVGDKPVTLETLKAHKMASFNDLSAALDSKKVTLSSMGIKRVFRLNSPKKGYGKIGIKKPVTLKGPLGYHPQGMDELLGQMM
jgi:large subunit ribosomal protein L30